MICIKEKWGKEREWQGRLRNRPVRNGLIAGRLGEKQEDVLEKGEKIERIIKIELR